MNDFQETKAIAKKLNEALNKELAKTVKTKTIDRKAFRDLFISHDWHHLPAAINDDKVSDQEFLAALQSVHEDIQTWTMISFTDRADEGLVRINLSEINLKNLDEDD